MSALARSGPARPRQSGRGSEPIAVHQVLATLGYGDAIGHEVLGIQRVLRAAGYESEIFVESADGRVEDLTVDYRELPDASHPDNILIHHFSIGSRASRIAYAVPDRMVLVYHNITPPEYFVGVHPALLQQCFFGRRELGFYASRCDLALGDSEYNRQELEGAGFPRTGVLPVIPGFSHLAGPANYMQAGAFDDDWVNLLFVGRMIPNKRIEDVIRWFCAYKRWFNPRSRLLLVGSYAGFEAYLAMLHQLIARIGAADVHFLGHVTNEELVAYYELADVFTCASEHEGFGVPLMEAFHMAVPVIAYAAAAVPATMDGGGILVTDKDPVMVGGLIHEAATNRALQDRIIATQDAALDRLEARDFGGTLLRFVEGVRNSPRRQHPPVAFDFWDQLKLADELEEIRVYRPAAYQALPKALGQTGAAGDEGRKGHGG
ncbi:MAG: glycosyltransferase family 4 protein [Acidobacteria bacterium]|nr:glycosyltransferase family 4 protein [Acidobacteriota bacterium]